MLNKELAGAADRPHFVAIPTAPQKAGYLGVRHAPLQTNPTPTAGRPFSSRSQRHGGATRPARLSSRARPEV